MQCRFTCLHAQFEEPRQTIQAPIPKVILPIFDVERPVSVGTHFLRRGVVVRVLCDTVLRLEVVGETWPYNPSASSTSGKTRPTEKTDFFSGLYKFVCLSSAIFAPKEGISDGKVPSGDQGGSVGGHYTACPVSMHRRRNPPTDGFLDFRGEQP